MPALQAYSRDLPYSYALGLFPASELMKKRPELARRLLVSSKAENSEGLAALRTLCSKWQVREEQADKALARVSGKENCFAAVVFDKFESRLSGRVALMPTRLFPSTGAITLSTAGLYLAIIANASLSGWMSSRFVTSMRSLAICFCARKYLGTSSKITSIFRFIVAQRYEKSRYPQWNSVFFTNFAVVNKLEIC